MSPTTDAPTIAPINGSAHADTIGTRLTREVSAPSASISGVKRSASHAAVGRRIRSGMRSKKPLPAEV